MDERGGYVTGSTRGSLDGQLVAGIGVRLATALHCPTRSRGNFALNGSTLSGRTALEADSCRVAIQFCMIISCQQRFLHMQPPF